ncbi:flagellar protein FlaG [Desulfosporosinus sp.]|uniref:flagellar protein FlaG n=1 Tax=Desulfosporosinus sp. TaxID=157907 RepID=UPI0025B86F95|nr:flagellar protein FlaG [Desulfosporosinus sp.]MBC2721907.1 flagellar protein FlaG [Desulfosporosinus sp.]MBC2728852.1 flagellar protein FlaG [Desulfosporosinus sp.]
MINPIQPNTQTTMIPMDAFAGQKLDRSLETPRKVIDRKGEIPSAREEIPREQVEKATEKLNRLMGIIDKRLEFQVHEEPECFMVKIIDQPSGEVLDEITPKRVLDILGSFTQVAGILFDELV